MRIFKTLLLLVCAASLWSCKKNAHEACGTGRPAGQPAPTAKFSIANLINDSTVLEGRPLDLAVETTGAVSYKWDFGDGNTSTERVPDFNFVVCSTHRKVILTVTNEAGASATFSKIFLIRCSRGYGSEHPAAPEMGQ